MTGWVVRLLTAVVLMTPSVPAASPVPSSTPQPVAIATNSIDAWIEQYAGEYGVPADTLRYIARCESSFNPKAVNGPYAGLYQYSASSWASNRKVMGEDPDPDLRLDAEESIKTTAYILSIRGGGMWPNCMPK